METNIENGWGLFLHKKPAKVILTLKDAEEPMYASSICKCVDCTYPHTLKILKKFETEGLVGFLDSEEDRRVNTVQLTEYGISVAHDVEGLIMKLTTTKETSMLVRKS